MPSIVFRKNTRNEGRKTIGVEIQIKTHKLQLNFTNPDIKITPSTVVSELKHKKEPSGTLDEL